MSDGEGLAGLIAIVLVILMWPSWYSDVFRVNRLTVPRAYRLILGLVPVACLVFLWLCLHHWAARAVRQSRLYIALYVVLGAAVLGLSAHLPALFGISARDDVLERRNRAALIAIVGVLVGATLCFTGGNIGEGSGIQVVLISAGTALCAWFALWCLAQVLSNGAFSERITIERDLGSGLRLAGMLSANAIVLGAAAAGDWIPDRFRHDFTVSSWPAVLITAIAILVEKMSQPRSSAIRSALIGLGYLIVATAWAAHQGITV